MVVRRCFLRSNHRSSRFFDVCNLHTGTGTSIDSCFQQLYNSAIRSPSLTVSTFPKLTRLYSTGSSVGGDGNDSHEKSCSQSTTTSYDKYNKELAKNDLLYCINLVKERDYENGYICGLLLPSYAQNAYFALRAFNVEIASIKDTSTIRYNQRSSGHDDHNNNDNPFEAKPTAPPSVLALQLRMQWWRNAIDVIYQQDSPTLHVATTSPPTTETPNYISASNDTFKQQENQQNALFDTIRTTKNASLYWNNPIVRSLHRAHEQVQFTKRFLERIIDIRETDLFIDQYSTITDCCTYADETISNLLLLTLECVNNIHHPKNKNISTNNSNNNHQHHTNNNRIMDEIVTSAGIGIGLATLLRATPYRLLATTTTTTSSGTVDMPLPSELFRPNFPYYQIVPSFINDDNTTATSRTSSNVSISSSTGNTGNTAFGFDTTNVDPIILSKLQRHIQSKQLSSDDITMLHNAVKTISDICYEHLTFVLQQLQQSRNNHITYEQKMCFLPIIPCMNYIYQLRTRYQYDLFQHIKIQQSHKLIVAKDRIQLFYQLSRTWMTGIY
jgi:hypothetical protein